jgi:hypothetical protein
MKRLLLVRPIVLSRWPSRNNSIDTWEQSALSNTTVGLWFGFFIALALVGGGIYSVAVGQSYVAGGFLTAGAIGMVPALIRGRDFVMQRQTQSSRQPAKPVPAKRSI